MGTTLTNIYLFPAPEKKELVSKLQKHFKTEGYKATKGEDGYDLSLFICSNKDKPCFISLEATDGTGIEQFIMALSESLTCDVLAVSLFDSDFLALVYRNHSERQSTVLETGYAVDEDNFVRRGDISSLFRLLNAENDSQKLCGVWDAKYVSEDARLSDMLALFGCDNMIYYESTKSQKLLFMRQEDDNRGYKIIRDGFPVLRISTGSINTVNNRPDAISFFNTGGPSKGLSVIMIGEFIDHLIENTTEYSFIEVHGYLNPTPLSTFDNKPERFSQSSRLSLQTSSDGRSYLKADFPDAPIPNGIFIDSSKSYSGRPPWTYFDFFFEPYIRFTFSIEQQEGLSKLPYTIYVSPLENWEKGSLWCKTEFWFDENEWEQKTFGKR